MAKIESIKQKILQLDAGSFQELCDAYLCKKEGHPGIVSLGGQAGTRKTTKGTPDTYFCTPNGKYIFVEYTTQRQRLVNKIKEDITKCLDISKTKISHNQIAEIIYCHTSSNIRPADDSEIKSLCQSVGIKLTIIGIDLLSEDLYLYHQMLVRDFLGISLSTEQILTNDDFIKTYNSHKMVAPIDTNFLFRSEEMKEIDDAFGISDIVVLSGAAGTGKTRLALEYAKEYSYKHNSKLYCVRNNGLPLHEDLKIAIDTPGNYFLLVDDANQLSGLQHIIHYVTRSSDGYLVKILITVRDYALKKVIHDIRELSTYQNILITSFNDDEIKQLLDTEFGIKNSYYIDRIIKIAEGNARLAILAGKVACDSNRLDSIQDASQLYDDYYGHFIDQDQILTNNDQLIAAGIVAFLETIRLDYLDDLEPIFNENRLSRDIFVETIYQLHHQEILDLCHNKAVRFSEQCLANYLLKHVFFDRKILSLSTMLHVCFPKYKTKTISSINTLLNIFTSEDVYNFVGTEVKLIWKKLQEEGSPYFFEYVKVFFRVDPTKTILILQEKITGEDSIWIEASDIDTEIKNNKPQVTNDILSLLGGFANMDDLPTALDLFFEYYIKRPDLFSEFYHTIIQYFCITSTSVENYFHTQIHLFSKMKKYSLDAAQDKIILLFLEVAKEFLKLHFSPLEGGRKNSITIHQIHLVESDGTKKYRSIIWEWLEELCGNAKYKDKVAEILSSYHGQVEAVSILVVQYDAPYIQSIIKTYFSPSEIKNCLLAKYLSDVFARSNIATESLFSAYFKEPQFTLFSILKGPGYEADLEYAESQYVKRKSIETYVLTCDLTLFKNLIDLCSNIHALGNRIKWEIIEGMEIAFDTVYAKQNYYVEAIRYYIEQNTPCDLNPSRLISPLFFLLSENEVFKLLTDYQYREKNAWMYSYYYELPKETIRPEHIDGLYDFLSQTSDKDINSSSLRNVNFLDKYSIIDENVFLKGCEIILAKKEYSPFIVNIYFGLLFDDHYNTPQDLIMKFSCNPELLCNIYFAQALNHNHDHDGKFLKEIYSFYQPVLDKYVDALIQEHSFAREHHELHICFFDTVDFINIYDRIFNQIVSSFQSITVPNFLENILLINKDDTVLLAKQDEWIRHCIQEFSDDEMKMRCLFEVLSKLNSERKKEYISLFLKNNSSFEVFEKISLMPDSWIGSAIPVYSAWIEFLQQLLPNFVGLEWIRHKSYIEERIDRLRKRIEECEVEEILMGDAFY